MVIIINTATATAGRRHGRGQGSQVPGTIGTTGPSPNSSEISVVSPAAEMPASVRAVPAKPKAPALWPDAAVDAANSPPLGASQSGSTWIFISMNSRPDPRSFARRRRRDRACSPAAAATAAISGCSAFFLAPEPALLLMDEPNPTPGGPTT